ncbi:MAG: hypothetical protein M1376_17675 [Planctomycetes bacterium]|nr:hypothetical protein [Planctomycetota bacterium]
MVRKTLMPNFEEAACQPVAVKPEKFNPRAIIPYGCTIEPIMRAMNDFTDFLCLINKQLHSKSLERLESFLMPANFSSIVGEFMTSAVPKYCAGLTKNTYHNGHPDMLPRGRFPGDAVQHAKEGIEVKASRHLSGWQGHNAEEIWLMVFVFDSNTSKDPKLSRLSLEFDLRSSNRERLYATASCLSRTRVKALSSIGN